MKTRASAGATVSIPAAMIFKKYYCHKCGERLKRQKITQTLNSDDPGYEAVLKKIHHSRSIIPMRGTVSVTEYGFACPQCASTITFDEQTDIAVKQKQASTRIL